MKLSIKKRIYYSFFILASVFILNGVIIVGTLNYNNKLSGHISEVLDPSVQLLNDFKLILIQSREFSINWVFLRSNEEYKKTLKEIHNNSYPALKLKLNSSSLKGVEPQFIDSLQNVFVNFEKVIVQEKIIMNLLAKFEDYDDLVKKFSAEELLENHVIPQTNLILNTLNWVILAEQQIKEKQETKVKAAALFMRALILILAISIIGLAILLSLYMKKIIIRPIDKIINIVNDLGKGVIKKVDDYANDDEMGRMIKSVNNLSDNLSSSTRFAHEIGRRNFNADYEPMSEEDKLGKALITMRDNLKSSDILLNEVQHIAKLGGWERTPKNNQIVWSDETLRIFDIDAADFNFSYQTYLDLIHPDDLEYVKNIGTNYLVDLQPISYEYRIITRKGIQKVLRAEGKVISNEKGEVIKTYGIVQDITASKKAEEELNKLSQRLLLATESGKIGIWEWDIVENKLDWDDNMYLLYGIKKENFEGAYNAWLKGLHPDDVSKGKTDIENAISGLKDFNTDFRVVWPNKEIHFVQAHATVIRNKEGKAIRMTGVNWDITERKEAEIGLRESEEQIKKSELRFRSLIENSADMIGIMDATGKFTYVSPGVIKKFGYSYEELFEMTILEVIHPDDLEKAQLFMGEVFQNPLVPVNGLVIRERCKDGSYIWAEGTITNLLTLDGVDAIVANFRDVTEKKEQQDILENSNKELRKSNQELDKFVYSVSHDLRAPLLSMQGIVGITAEETNEEMTGEHMQMLSGSIARLDNFIGEILDYSKNARTEIRHDNVDFKKLLHEIKNNLQHMNGNSKPVNIQFELKGTGTISTDKSRLSVILNNLISNSIRYSNPKAEKPYVKIRVATNDKEAVIEVEDNGIGIKNDYHEKIFDMFYRVSENSVGSGLGLYITKETINKLHGKIEVDSKPGVGTTFKLTLPNFLYQ